MMKIDKNSSEYKKALQEEAKIWSESSNLLVAKYGGVPEWKHLSQLSYNQVYRGEFFNKTLSQITKGKNVLELGCSTGWFSFEAYKKGANVDAVDIAEGAIELARDNLKKNYPKSKNHTLNFICHDINFLESCTKLKKQYDVIVIKGLLHHLPEYEKLLKFLKTKMHKNSVLIVDDSNETIAYQQPINASSHIILNEMIPFGVAFLKSFYRLGKALVNWSFARSVVHSEETSPFEGVTSGRDVRKALDEIYQVKSFETYAAFIGNITCPIENYPSYAKNKIIPYLKKLNVLDKKAIKMKVAEGTNFFGTYFISD